MKTVSFAELLDKAVTEPGQLSAAFQAFHHYSFGNQVLAMMQCMARGIAIGPIASFMGWKAKGRSVRKGEKAIVLCMPVAGKRVEKKDDGTEEAKTFTRFIYRPNWFVLAQTEGADVTPALPTWDATRALAALDVTEQAFDLVNGNVLGYARGRAIAINPVGAHQMPTRFHELAHVLLGHTEGGVQLEDGAKLTRAMKELEAECVAMLCCAALGLDGIEESRGYIQNWWGQGNPIPERAAQRILKVVDQILKAGAPPADAAQEVAA